MITNAELIGWMSGDRKHGVNINAGVLNDIVSEVITLRADRDAAQAQVAALREALDKARDPSRDPDYCYDEEWEYTIGFDQAHELMENHDLTEPVEFYTLFKGPRKWAVNVPKSWDEDGDQDDWDIEIFDTEAEARAALTPPADPAAKIGGDA